MKQRYSDEVRIAILTVVIVVGVVAFGIVGYMLVEGWDFFDALYQTALTISTVGFHEVHELSTSGRIVTMFLILFAISLFGYFFSRFVTVMVEGRLRTFLKGRKMQKQIARLRDHIIICGYGRMGNQVALEFREAGIPFVVIDTNAATFERENMDGILWMLGDACREEDLEECGIARAQGLVSVLAEDQHNIYAVLTARGLNTDLRIVTRATEEESESKLLRAGANHVISPFKIGGSRIAAMMMQSSITHYLEGLKHAEEFRLSVLEVTIKQASSLIGKSIRESGVIDITDSIIVGLRRPAAPIMVRPPMDTVLGEGDQLIVMGRLEAIQRVDHLAGVST